MKCVLSEDKILHNSVVLSGFEFVEERPIGFFEFDDVNDKNKIFKDKNQSIKCKGTLEIKDYGFEATQKPDGTLVSEEVCIVSRAKARRVLIFQDIDFCKNHHNNVFIIPIQSLYKPTLEQYGNNKIRHGMALKLYESTQNRDDSIYDRYYFPKVDAQGNIKERVLVLSDAKFVHRTMLFQELPEDGLTKEELETIQIRLSKMLKIETIEKCSECKLNYMNYSEQANLSEKDA